MCLIVKKKLWCLRARVVSGHNKGGGPRELSDEPNYLRHYLGDILDFGHSVTYCVMQRGIRVVG